MEVLPKAIICTWILPYLPQPGTGRPSRVDPIDLLEAILYKLKTCCQWRYLPVKQFFTEAALTWRSMYARFHTWRKAGSWQTVRLRVLRVNKRFLDCSTVQLDGSYTPANNGGAAVGYQGRQKGRTTTALFLADNQGQPLAYRYRAGEEPPRQLSLGGLI
jgi:transposase